MKKLVQLLASHHRYDAIGGEAIVIDQLMREAGWRVQTYAQFVDSELALHTRGIEALGDEQAAEAVALYHYSVCSPVSERFLRLPCAKALIYHNVTPPEFFRPYDVGLAGVAEESLRQIDALAGRLDLGIGDSEFNRRELERMGCLRTRVLPILLDRSRYAIKPDERMLERIGPAPVVLFVGRVAPNKGVHDFVRAAGRYFARPRAAARFVVAGKRDVLPSYSEELESLMAELELGEEQLWFAGEVSQPELVALYSRAGAFLSLSRHEGFMVPLLESMLMRVPVLALRRAAVPETLGEAGILFDSAEADRVAELVERVLSDEEMRTDMVKRGAQRVERYETGRWAVALASMLEELARCA